MDKFKAESEQLKGHHENFFIHIKKFTKDLEEMDSKLLDLELKCYMHGNDDCLAHCDNYFLASLATDRKLDSENMRKSKQCWSVIPYSLRPKSEFAWSVKTEETLAEYKKFYDCSKPFYQKILVLYKEKCDLKRGLLKKLNEFNTSRK